MIMWVLDLIEPVLPYADELVLLVFLLAMSLLCLLLLVFTLFYYMDMMLEPR